jgi:hypothetical protein
VWIWPGSPTGSWARWTAGWLPSANAWAGSRR